MGNRPSTKSWSFLVKESISMGFFPLDRMAFVRTLMPFWKLRLSRGFFGLCDEQLTKKSNELNL
ncbi:MAG: hypothetical protein CMH46_10345 [Muricauda sp.]|nr:hypothetical protein [Allomuricauda sp.]